MLLEFTMGNFASFGENRTFTFEGEALNDEPRSNVIVVGSKKILRSAAIYGANSSGKSNFIKGFSNMKACMIESARLNERDSLPHNPFLFMSSLCNGESFYEIILYLDSQVYRYGFEFNHEKIVKEWLYLIRSRSEKALFLRENGGIGCDKKAFKEGLGLESRTNNNRLFLSVCGQLGGEISNSILHWFYDQTWVLSGLNELNYEKIAEEILLNNGDQAQKMMKALSDLDLGFQEISCERVGDEGNVKIFVKHDFSDNGKPRTVHCAADLIESEGTKKLISLMGPFIDALDKGKLLMVDELDSRLHPHITVYLIRLFNDPSFNEKGAQLIFTTHDTNLLSLQLFRRDQIWFTEKDGKRQTDMYRLCDIRGLDVGSVRKDANWEKNYLKGRYGAIPFVNIAHFA